MDQHRLERKALVLMAGIGSAEIAAILAALWRVSPATLHRLLTQGTIVGWLAALLTAAIFIAVTISRLPMISAQLFKFPPHKFAGIVFGLLAGLAEELWYRKIPMDWLARGGHGAFVQTAVAGLLFGIAHAVWGLFAGAWRAALSAMVATAALGAALALVYLIGSRDIAPCIWAHAAIDVVLEPWLLLAVLSRSKEIAGASRGMIEA